MTFFGIVFVTFVNILSVAFIISSHTITKLSAILFRHLLLSQIHVLEFRLKSLSLMRHFSQSHWHVSLFHFLFELYAILSNFHLQSYEVCFRKVLASYVVVVILNTLTLMSFVLLRL